MSDQWQIFLRREEGEDLFILTDVGAHSEIDAIAPRILLRIDLQVISEGGYPDAEEDEALNTIEDHVNPTLEALGSLYVGRITRAGMRSLFHYLEISETQAEALAADIETRFARKAGTYLGADPEHLVYKAMLYPRPEEWSVIRDFETFDALGENGDSREEPRDIAHWACFPDRTAAERFAAIVQKAGYRIADISMRPEAAGGRGMAVKFKRVDIPAYGAFTDANIELRKVAAQCGGEYDGWESVVVRQLQ